MVFTPKFRLPVMVSPDLSTFNEAAPMIEAVIVPAEKLPDPSLATMVETVLESVASVAMVTLVAPL